MNAIVPDPRPEEAVSRAAIRTPSPGMMLSEALPEDGRLRQCRPAVHDDRLLRFIDAWLTFRGTRTMPSRADIAPQAFPDLLPMLYIYERRAPGSFRCVLAGEDIHQAWRGTIMGRDVTEMFAPADLPQVLRRWSFVLDRPAALHGFNQVPGGTTSSERVLLPLSDGTGAPRYLFGMTIYQRGLDTADVDIDMMPKARLYALSSLAETR